MNSLTVAGAVRFSLPRRDQLQMFDQAFSAKLVSSRTNDGRINIEDLRNSLF